MSDTKAQLVSQAEFPALLEDANKNNWPVFVDFYAEWCGPCRQAAPVVDELAGEYAGKAVVVKVDVDENRELAQEYGVMSIPTTIVLRGGDELDRLTGYMGEAKYRSMIEAALAAN